MLNLDVADCEIDMGVVFNSSQTVRLIFRRPPDGEIRATIQKLQFEYGWQISEGDRSDKTDYAFKGDFYICCVGAASDNVGNAIGEMLEREHGIKVIYKQYIPISPGQSKWQTVDRLQLEVG